MTLEEVKAKLGARAAAVARVLQTDDGRKMMEALDEVFVNGDLLGKDDRETNFRLGGREVVLHLHRLAQYHERAGNRG